MARSVVFGVVVSCLAGLLGGCGSLDSEARSMARALPPDADFTHPGILVGKSQLKAVRENVTAGKQPWLKAYLDMRDSEYGSYRYTPKPSATVSCPTNGRPGPGCRAERRDAIAAYTQALLFTVTGKEQHAAKATAIMDAWSAKLKRHTGGNAALQAAWSGATWARAAEIIRYTPDSGWPQGRVRRFEDMLRTAHLPEVTARVPDFNGNWDLAMTNAALAIAVFLDDHQTFDDALARARARVPAYFYLAKDGPRPRPPKGGTINTPAEISTYWFGQKTYKDGLTQETCHDFRHVGYSLAATAHIAETAWHQGVDLYDELKDRLTATLTLHARHQLRRTGPTPAWLCAGKADRNMGPHLEVVLNHLDHRLDDTGDGDTPLDDARELARRTRPAGADGRFVSWETLTHANNPG
ncbi:alginate lyase family protein [Streptomyces sp. NPDC006997]|uniref:alginate lyase family protein n=1 Tax=Streptomyces sp. NPDC006997 TaxID=3155356 RepID=UPI0033D1D4E2